MSKKNGTQVIGAETPSLGDTRPMQVTVRTAAAGLVVVELTRSVMWFGMPPQQAHALGLQLIEAAKGVRPRL